MDIKTVDIFKINNYSLQEVIEFVAYNMIKQNQQAAVFTRFGDVSSCHLRFNGKKCALGWCIPDDKYSPDMEENSEVSTFMDEYKIHPSNDVTNLLTSLQTLHDEQRPYYWDNSHTGLPAIAEAFELDVDRVQAVIQQAIKDRANA